MWTERRELQGERLSRIRSSHQRLQRQSMLVARSEQECADQAFVDTISDRYES